MYRSIVSANRLTWRIWNKKQESYQQDGRQKLGYERCSIRPFCLHVVRTLVDTSSNELRQIDQSLIHDHDEPTKICRRRLGPIWNHKVCGKPNPQPRNGSSNYHDGERACACLNDWADDGRQCGRRKACPTAIASAKGTRK